MPDREKYIEVLSKTAKTVKEYNEDVPIKISLICIEDILELLKEQQKQIKQMNFIYGFVYGGQVKEIKELVRCKDCKHGEKANDVYLCGKSRGFGIAHEPDFFCADGERR